MSLRQGYLIIILMGFFAISNAQDNKEELKLSVNDAQEYALRNNRSVASSRTDIEIARKKVWETVASGLPQINFAANYMHQFQLPELSFGPVLDVQSLPEGVITKSDILNAYKPSPPIALGVRNNTTFDFTLSQLIFSGEYLVGLQAMKVLQSVSEKTLVKTEDQTRESVANSYYLILVLEENARVLENSHATTEKIYNELAGMNKEGFNEETDVDQMKISLSNIETLLNSVKSQHEISMKLLKFQLGLDFDQPVTLTDSLGGIVNQGNVQYMSNPEFNINNSIDYQLVSTQEQISALLLRRQQSKLLPVISGFYRHEEQTNRPVFNFAVKDVAGISLSFPIATSGMRMATISQAKFDLYKSRLAKADAEQGLTMEFETAKSSYQTAFNNFRTNEESMALSKKVYERTVIKYREGVSSSFELSQNQAQYLTAESNYYNSLLSLLNAKAKLDRILTGGRQ